MPKGMFIDERNPEVGVESIVRRAALLREYQIPSNIDEYPTSSGPKRVNHSQVPREAWCGSGFDAI
jgi:hypothetical protein